MISASLARAGRIAFIFAIVNFAVYFVVAILIGGDAVNGHAVAGHYYLASHGKLTETTYRVFLYSQWHTYSLYVSHPLGALGWWVNQSWKRQH